MILTKEQIKEFEQVVRPVMAFLSTKPQTFHPHIKIIITYDRAEILEGSCSFVTEDYVVD